MHDEIAFQVTMHLAKKLLKEGVITPEEYVSDFLQKTRKKNDGEVAMYYVEKHHEGIITPEQYAYVQAEIRRRAGLGKYSGSTIFSGRIRCACCGGWYGPKVWHSKDKYKRTVYRCNEKYRTKGQKACDSPTLTEEQIKQMFIMAVNRLVEVKEEAAANIRMLAETVCDTSTLASERDGLCGELDALSGNDKRAILTGVTEQLQTVEGGITEFDPQLWGGLVERIDVDKHAATVVFRSGIAIGV